MQEKRLYALGEQTITRKPPLPPKAASDTTDTTDKPERPHPPQHKFHKRENPSDIILNINLVLRKKNLQFVEKDLAYNFTERHYGENGELLIKNYFFQAIQNLYVMSLTASGKKKKKRVSGKTRDVLRNQVLINNIDNSNPEDTKEEGFRFSPPPSPVKPGFQFDNLELIFNCALLFKAMADAHNNAMARQNGYSFRYLNKLAALAKVLDKADNFYQNMESPIKSHDLMAALTNLQNAIETPATRFVREHPMQSHLIFGIVILLGLSILGAGLLLLPTIPLAAMNMLIAGSLCASLGLITWAWSPLANLLAPDEDLNAVADTSTKAVASFRTLIDSSASFFNRTDTAPVIHNQTSGMRSRMKVM